MKIKSFALLAALLIASSVFAADLTLEEIIANVKSNQTKIHDMYAETTTITSNMAMPGQEGNGPQKMIQKAKMWTKGKDKSRIEVISPMKQITITNGDILTVINQDTGQTFTQDLSKTREKAGLPSGANDLTKALDYFDLSVSKKDDQYIISGKPKQSNKFLGRMEFYIDSERWLPVKIVMYTPTEKVMSTTEMEHEETAGAWVAVKASSSASMPMGTIKTEMVYENIQVNKGIADGQFEGKI